MERYNEDSTLSNPGPIAAAHLGEAIVQLRRLASDQISGPLTRKLLDAADGLQAWVPPVERLERVCGGQR